MYRVLIVDDEPFIVDGLLDAVDWSAYGLEVVGRAKNGREAFEALQAKPVDILITDITMPVMNGLELICAVRQASMDLKVVVLSGYNEFEYLKEGMALGIENYLLKPVNFTELGETLRGTVRKLNEQDRSITEEQIDILKDNIMHRWLTGRIAADELSERFRLLEISIAKPYMLVAVLRCGGNGETLHAEAKRWFAAEPSAVYFHDVDGDAVIVFTADDPQRGKREALESLRAFHSALDSPLAFRISVGSVERAGENEQRSYSFAKKAQEYYLLYDRPDLIDYDDIALNGGDPQLPPNAFDWQEYAKWIMSKDTKQLHDKIAADLKRLQTADGATPGMLKSAAMELIIRFKMELAGLKLAGAPNIAGYEACLRKAIETSRIDELAAAVGAAAALTVNLLAHDDKSPIVKQVLDHIHAHYAEPLSLKMLGRRYNAHPVYLGHLFRKETNATFTDYMNKYRIEKAKELLKKTNLKVHEIAKQVGYWETGYFYKQFKKYVGISPTEFKGLG